MTDQNDELLEGFDEPGGLSADEYNRRIEAYNDKVDKYVRGIRNAKADPTKRAKAIAWLGDNAATDAIPTLVDLYENDPSPKVRQAAEQALGQFRALENQVRGSDDPLLELQDTLEQIVVYGDDKPAKSSGGWGLQIGLMLLLVVLIAANVLIPSLMNGGTPVDEDPTTIQSDVTPTEGVTAPPEQVAQAELSLMRDQLDADARILQNEMLTATRGESINCDATLYNVDSYTLDPAVTESDYPALVEAANRLNDGQETLSTAIAIYRRSCAQNIAIQNVEALQQSQAIVNLQRELTEIAGLLATSGVQPAELPATATPEPTITPAPTATTGAAVTAPEDTQEADATEDSGVTNDEILEQVRRLRFIIDEMNGFRGHNTLLNQYWTDIQQTGSTGGCFETPPTIPQDFILEQQFIDVTNPTLNALSQAVANTNLGLTLSRQSWAVFTQACQSGSTGARSAQEITRTDTARGAFDDATANLDTVQAATR